MNIIVMDLEWNQNSVSKKDRNSDKPVFIACKTTIGFGAPTKAGKASVHGAPLGGEELDGLRKALNWSASDFEVPADILSDWRQIFAKGRLTPARWRG